MLWATRYTLRRWGLSGLGDGGWSPRLLSRWVCAYRLTEIAWWPGTDKGSSLTLFLARLSVPGIAPVQPYYYRQNNK